MLRFTYYIICNFKVFIFDRTNFHCFINNLCLYNFLTYLDSELKDTYDFYQDILPAIKHRKFELFNTIINHASGLLSQEMKTSLKVLIQCKDYIHDMIDSNYTNGDLEGINNKIKSH
ncbi:MAG: transposase [Turicibacter sp.]|nr:transposase [Turicibacter sp.]